MQEIYIQIDLDEPDQLYLHEMIHRLIHIVLSILFFFSVVHSKAAEIRGFFDRDSALVGEHVVYTLVYKHDRRQQVFFPDSAFDYQPFEYIHRRWFETYTQGKYAVDSVQYLLRSFEMNAQNALGLPVFILQDGDTLLLQAGEKTIFLKPFVNRFLQTDTLQTNTNPKFVSQELNYEILGVSFLAVFLLFGLIFLLFGKRIRKAYRLRLMNKTYNAFMQEFESIALRIQANATAQDLEQLPTLWKKYLQKLTSIPYSTYTTREISLKLSNRQLISSLQNFDRAIYGGRAIEDLSQSILILKEAAQQNYLQKREEVKNA